MKDWKQIGQLMLALSLAVVTARAASMTIPAGATISVRMSNSLDSKANRTGETFHASVDSALMLDGKIVVPKGAEAIGRVTSVESAGLIKGRSVIAVELTALNFDGKSMTVRTSTHQEASRTRTLESAIIIGGGTALGTVVGAVAGAPWLGIKVGTAAGMAVHTVRGRAQVRIPAESLLVFTLQSPLPLEGGVIEEASAK